jgi:heme-degrading monooxygenase HmoA
MVRMKEYKVRNWIIWLALAAVPATACTGDDGGASDDVALDERIEALADCVPGDTEIVSPWIGPAFDAETGQLLEPLPEGHVEAVAQGWRIYTDEAQALRVEHGQKVLTDLLARDGFLGFESVESAECDISIAHSLWRDEASMFAFVTTAPHATARAAARTMHRAFAGAHWTGPTRDTPPTWQEGIARYVQEVRAKAR